MTYRSAVLFQISAGLNLDQLRERVWQILPCSAKTGEGLQEGMEWIVEQINSEGKEVSDMIIPIDDVLCSITFV